MCRLGFCSARHMFNHGTTLFRYTRFSCLRTVVILHNEGKNTCPNFVVPDGIRITYTCRDGLVDRPNENMGAGMVALHERFHLDILRRMDEPSHDQTGNSARPH